MDLFKIEEVSFFYPDAEQAVIRDISFTVQQGQFIVLCGPSGSGKTTLLKQLKRSVQPSGRQKGQVLYQGIPLHQVDAEKEAAEIGFVFQDPENQIVTSTPWHEMAFALENRGISPMGIRKRVAEIANFLGIEDWFHRPVYELSGGQKQLLNLASVLVMKPKVLLLDEPTAQLDPISSREFIQTLGMLRQELSMTIILSEHRLDEVVTYADRIIVLEQGQLKWMDEPRKVMTQLSRQLESPYYSYIPDIPALYFKWNQQGGEVSEVPLSVQEGKQWLKTAGMDALTSSKSISGRPIKADIQPSLKHSPDRSKQVPLLRCSDVTFHYDHGQPPILNQLNLSVYRAEMLAILGGNGAGKSTLLQLMARLLKASRGSIQYHGKQVGYVPQNPMATFVHDTVRDELSNARLVSGEMMGEQELETFVRQFQIEHLLGKHPYDCSGGERQKIAMISALLSKPDLLLLDEPTKGLDPFAKQLLGNVLQQLMQQQDLAIVLVSHDIEFAAQFASRCALLFDGSITCEGAPNVFFSDLYFYTTAIHRLVRDDLPWAVTMKDVLRR